MTYCERLRVPWWWMLVGLLFVASVGIAVIAYLPLATSIAVIALSFIAVTIGLIVYSSTQVTVDEDGLSAGRYRLETRYIANAEALEGTEAEQAIGQGADPRAFLLTRPYLSDAVRVHLNDPADPHPYWFISTRRPKELAAAITALENR